MLESIISLLNTYQHIFIYLGIVSSLCFVLSLVAIPLIIKRLPADYFTYLPPEHAPVRLSLKVVLLSTCKNIIGLILILAGLIMLITPGQGVLTVLVGILVSDFPGKLAFERWLITRSVVKHSLNWIRRKQNLAEFTIE